MQIVQPFRKVKGYIEIDVQTQTIDNFCLKNNIKNEKDAGKIESWLRLILE